MHENKDYYFERVEIGTDAKDKVDDVVLKQVDEFGYLGCAFSRDGGYTADIEKRVNTGNHVNGALWKLLGSKTVRQKT